jgi:hypothetical protein
VGHPESPLGLSEQSECGKMVCPTSLEAARPVRCPQLGQEALGCFPPKLENLQDAPLRSIGFGIGNTVATACTTAHNGLFQHQFGAQE